jgi:hypothetical protein
MIIRIILHNRIKNTHKINILIMKSTVSNPGKMSRSLPDMHANAILHKDLEDSAPESEAGFGRLV